MHVYIKVWIYDIILMACGLFLVFHLCTMCVLMAELQSLVPSECSKIVSCKPCRVSFIFQVYDEFDIAS